ncbi:helix-turn-helix domain-containing protein, partial [Faecalibacterium sp.]|uniref:helix-turn-helix domain-containing protein n=1 Tax=Faecalibacterium sp. TaxID=1971605 RepID=UPI004026EE2B
MSREPTRAAILIRESRKRAGLTQQALAEKLGITTSAVCKYESGGTLPKAANGEGRCVIISPTTPDPHGV